MKNKNFYKYKIREKKGINKVQKFCFDLKIIRIRGEDWKCLYGQGFLVLVVIMKMLLFMVMKVEIVDIKMRLLLYL